MTVSAAINDTCSVNLFKVVKVNKTSVPGTQCVLTHDGNTAAQLQLSKVGQS